MEKTDGGPAFPLVFTDRSKTEPEQHIYGGISVRDYFAKGAMEQAIAHHVAVRATMIRPGDFNFSEIARTAYMVADAMLAERAK